jgi:hypothetical protein
LCSVLGTCTIETLAHYVNSIFSHNRDKGHVLGGPLEWIGSENDEKDSPLLIRMGVEKLSVDNYQEKTVGLVHFLAD